ncbi:leishmanolysin-like peptidase 2 [Melanotaenia boesemani]|uniref:leishmanolysin-like peptidase 2 n=1 Tax=Melanotaenia boesemani TaxID=1250792 RepID=UPI001C04A52B|nr:leishmanolysin-like peptidase 2 [Melanotaenia boesemani]
MLLVVLVMMLELPGALHKCIFDDVQAQVKVVRAAPIQSHDQPKLKALNGIKHLQTSRPPARHAGVAVKLRSVLGESASPTSAAPQSIRIKTWTTTESDNLSKAERGRLDAAVHEALRVISSVLSVNRTVGPLLLRRDINKYCKFLWKNSSTINYNRCGRANSNYRSETCLDVTIPDDHLAGCHIYPEAGYSRRIVLRTEGAGLSDTDFLLYLHMQTTDKCRAELNVLAYAAHCQTDTHGRPVAGVVVFCRDRLKGTTYSHQTTVQTVIHELFHALGFSKELFSTWRDCFSSPEDGRCSPRGKVIHSDGSGQVRIYTPSIISALQKHLVSTDSELGGPLENLDASTDRLSSHWESRVLQGSIMAAVLEDPTTVRIDPVTLAALQDTGWYTVNLSWAQSLVWGDGEGATFGSLSTCQDNSSFFCSGSRLGCHFLHLHKGECQTDQYLEGCRIYKLLKNGSECWKKENSRWPAGENWSGEIHGFDSRCFFSSLIRQEDFVQISSSVEGRCYRHRCTGLNRYQIQVFGSGWVDCPAGDTIQIEGYQGSVFCPDRRLCLYPDVTPPSENGSSLHRPPADSAVAAALCFTAAVCFLIALLVSYRKCQTSLVRIHNVSAENHNEL